MSVSAITTDPQPESRFGTYQLIPVGRLQTDGTYQRPVSLWRVNQIVYHYEPILFQPLIVGSRAGKLYVIDGQHRLGAAQRMGFPNVPCMVYVTASAAEEARVFLWLQERRRVLTSPQKFKAKMAFGDRTARNIDKVLRHYGFETGEYEGFRFSGAQSNIIVAVRTLELIYESENGGKVLDDLLYVLRHAWDGRPASLQRPMLNGLATFMREHQYGVKALVGKLKPLSPVDLMLAADAVGSARGLDKASAMAHVIGNVYRGVPARSLTGAGA